MRAAAPLRAGVLGAALLGAAPGAAALELEPYVSARQEYDSNVFSLPDRRQALIRNGDPQLDDLRLRASAGVAARQPLGGQTTLYGTAEARRLDYRTFDRLDHEEGLVAAGLDWTVLGEISGTLDFRQERRMASFADRRDSGLTVERDRAAGGSFRVQLTPDWRIETGLRRHELESPLPGHPAFALDETARSLGIAYASGARLELGAGAEYLDARFRGVPSAPAYTLDTVQLTARYAVSELSAFDGRLGHSQFADRGGSGDDGYLTGALGASRQLSALTEVHAQAFRRVGSYAVGANAVAEKGVGAGLRWQPTVKLGVRADYAWTRGAFRDLGAGAGADAGRRDRTRTAGLSVDYQALRWLAVAAFGEYRERDSSVALNRYHGTLAGVELRVLLR